MREKKGGCERKNMRMVRPRNKGSDESDEDYNVGEDEEFDESDDEYGFTYDVDETEEILDLLEDGKEFVETKMKKVGRPNVKEAGHARGMKITRVVKPKKRRILRREEDEDEEEEEEEEEEEDDDDGDDEDYDFDDEMTNKVVKPQKKKRVSFREEDDDYVCADDDIEDEKLNEVARRRKKKRVLYREEDDDDYNGVPDDFNDEKVISVVKARGKKRVSYREEDDDDYNGSDHDINDKRVNSVVKPRGKKRVSYREEDDDDYRGSDDTLNDEKVNSAVKDSYRREDGHFDVTDDQSDDEKVSKVAKPRKGKEVSYSEEDDDDNDNDYNGADDEFDDEKVVLAVKPRGKRRVSYRVEDDDDGDDDDDDDYNGADDEYDDGKVNLIVKRRGKRRVSYRVEDDDDDYDYHGADGEFKDEKVNLVVKPRGRSTVSYREDDVDYDGKDGKFDDEEKVIKVANQRKKKEVSYREKDDDYDGMDDDDDDEHDATDDDDDYEEEEFTPNEINGVDDVDDEDELLVMKENKKLGRPRVQGKCVIGGWKSKRKRNSNVSNKTMINKPIKNHQPCRKRETGKDIALISSKPIVEEKKEKVSERRRRGRIVHSDSDFVISGSSDYEYTISEDESEQIHEANKFCRSLTTSLRNSTSSSKLDEEKKISTRRKRLTRKGKEKVEDLKVEVVKQVCGICLTEEGKRTVRGTLNCCSHYFCFACIMEWSKVESRCPLCKQRFGTISKPARSNTGFDLRTAVIQIPERDQVYQPSEEELLGFLDPYDYVICTECHHGGDDALMLLCDLCDSPAHTYCVGLGREVPEGNWYCEGCRPAALGSSNPQVSTPRPSSPVSSIRETFDLNEMYVPETPLIHENSQLPSPRASVGDVQLPSPAFGSGAFTVLERRRIQHQINQLLRRQMDFRAPGIPTTVSGHSLFDAQVDRLGTQHVVTPEMMFANNIYFHDTTTPILQNPEVPSARLTHIHLSQNQPSTSTNGSFNGYIRNEFDGLNSSIGLRLGHQQLQPCSSRSNTGSDANTSSYPFREGTVPSVTLQEALHTHF